MPLERPLNVLVVVVPVATQPVLVAVQAVADLLKHTSYLVAPETACQVRIAAAGCPKARCRGVSLLKAEGVPVVKVQYAVSEPFPKEAPKLFLALTCQ